MDVRLLLMLALGGLALLAIAARAFSAPMKLAAKAAVNMALGFSALLLLNAASPVTGEAASMSLPRSRRGGMEIDTVERR